MLATSRPMVAVLVCALITPGILAEQVPGTSVILTPPEGFVKSDRFHGFMMASTGSSIVINEVPAPYLEATAGLSDPERVQAQGMSVLSRSSVKVDGRYAMLLHVEQAAYGTLFRKWLLAVDRGESTALIVASYPAVTVNEQEKPLRESILAASFGPPTDPIDALTFTVTPVVPFEIAHVMGQMLILSPGGQFPVTDEDVPSMIVMLSPSEDLTVPDQEAFAEEYLARVAGRTVEDIVVVQSVPVEIGSLAGVATTVRGVGKRAATPLTIYQVMLFDASGYSLIQGQTPSAEKTTYVPLFEKIAETFALKDNSGGARSF